MTVRSAGSRGMGAIRTAIKHPTFWALIGAIALAAIYGRVAVANLTYGVVGGNSNGYEDVWNDYWLKTRSICTATRSTPITSSARTGSASASTPSIHSAA